MNEKTRVYTLDDGSTTTVEQMVKELNWAKSTCYSRLQASTDPSKVYKKLSPTRRDGRVVYTLDDGSEWTAKSLAEHLDCKVSTAGTRLSMMKGDSTRILKPVKKHSDSNSMDDHKDVKKRLRERMIFDIHGHWSLLNRCL